MILPLSQGLQFLAIRSSQILCPVRTPGHEDQELGDAALHKWLLPCLSWAPATVQHPSLPAWPQWHPSSHDGIPDACIPMVVLGKCINKYIGMREKDSCSLGDFHPRQNKTNISVAHLAPYSASIQGRYNISGLHICLKWRQLSSKVKFTFKYWWSYQILSLCQHWLANCHEILKAGKKENLSKLAVSKISGEKKMHVSKDFKII